MRVVRRYSKPGPAPTSDLFLRTVGHGAPCGIPHAILPLACMAVLLLLAGRDPDPALLPLPLLFGFLRFPGLGGRLAESEWRLREVVDMHSDIGWEIDTECRFVFISAACQTLLGYTRDELAGRPFFQLIDIDERSRVERELRAFVQARKPFRRLEYQHVHKDGHLLVLEMSGAPAYNTRGRFTGFRGISRDVSKQRSVENLLRSAHDELEQLVDVRTEQLSRTNETLRREVEKSRRAEDALGRERDFITAVLDTAGALVVVLDREGRILRLNRASEAAIGQAFEQVRLRMFWDLFSERDSIARVRAVFARLRNGEHPLEFEGGLVGAGGEYRHILWSNTVILDQAGAVDFMIATGIDLTEHRKIETQNTELAEFPRRNPHPIVAVDGDGQVIYANPTAERLRDQTGMLGWPRVLPQNHSEIISACLATGQGREDVEVELHRRTWSWQYHPLPEMRRVYLYALDITERKRFEAQLVHDALHDGLTGLPNRVLFTERLDRAIAISGRRPGEGFAVLLIDLDRFKNINDSYGHESGDRLLIELCKRFNACIRQNDTLGRLGGDEFAILVSDLRDAGEATRTAERIHTALRQPLSIGDQEFFASVSIGIAVHNGQYARPEHVLRDADTAMYRAKALGRARHVFFDEAMHAQVVNTLQLETDLRKAISRGEFVAFYQPIVSLQSGVITGMEALIRWRHPERGLVPPDRFIPIAEETGLILPIDDWMMREACRQAGLWSHDLRSGDPLKVSVNLSGKQFTRPDLVHQVETILHETAIEPSQLKIEITESAVMEQPERAAVTLSDLKSLQVQLALDDFGTGYSSLKYLHSFPLDVIKIDRSFVMNLTGNGKNIEIVRTILTLAGSLGMDVVAEGIETGSHLSLLRELGCPNGQGYFFSRPLESSGIEQLLLSDPHW